MEVKGAPGIFVNILIIIMCYTKVPLCIYPIAGGINELVPSPVRTNKSIDASSPRHGSDAEVCGGEYAATLRLPTTSNGFWFTSLCVYTHCKHTQ